MKKRLSYVLSLVLIASTPPLHGQEKGIKSSASKTLKPEELYSIDKIAGNFFCWSPDGEWIAFMSEQSGNRDIWIMRADGTQKIRLSYDPGMDVWPRWSPDGTKIAYGSQRQAKDRTSFDIRAIDLEEQLGKEWSKKDRDPSKF